MISIVGEVAWRDKDQVFTRHDRNCGLASILFVLLVSRQAETAQGARIEVRTGVDWVRPTQRGTPGGELTQRVVFLQAFLIKACVLGARSGHSN